MFQCYPHSKFGITFSSGLDGKDGLTVYTKQDGSPFRPAHPLDGAAQTPTFQTVHIGFQAPADKGAFFIPMSESLMKELHTAENLCRLSPPKNPKVIRVLASILAPGFNCTEKAMRKLLCCKGGILT